jgi:hypothetical protein
VMEGFLDGRMRAQKTKNAVEGCVFSMKFVVVACFFSYLCKQEKDGAFCRWQR